MGQSCQDSEPSGSPASQSTTIQAVLKDPVLDEHLAEKGFAVVPFETAESHAAPLIDAYGDLHGWDGRGFEPDLINPDAEYRRSVTAAIGSVLDGPAMDLFTAHQPFLRNFLCKWPGEGSELYLHRDWMYVDERHGARTFVVWIPLQDVDESNGPLQVLSGSHRLDDRLRGTNLNAPWIALEDVIRPRLETVTSRLGQAVILNNSLVHCSLPNPSDNPRLVAAIGVRPTTSPLVHFRLEVDEEAVRYDVDEDFFVDLTPQGLMEAAPRLPIQERLSASQLELDAEGLARLLARGEPPTLPGAARTWGTDLPRRREDAARLARRVDRWVRDRARRSFP